mgnify:CR=1 FL=1
MRKIGIQGIKGSYHDQVAKEYFGDAVEINEFLSFDELADSVFIGSSDFGIMAIENSIAGSIIPNYALIDNLNLNIVGECFVNINHQLMALPGVDLNDIETVSSHPMALLQCKKFFKDFPKISLIEARDTAGEAKRISENKIKNVGAIASVEASKLYELNIIHKNIQTIEKNETRFVYVLPESDKRALVEYTLFSKTLLPEKEYLEEIKKYLDSIDTGGYKILEKEKGQIPMTCFRFDNYNTEDLLHIGTAGGWTKASTGYTFSRINEKTKALINHLKKEKPLNRFNQTNRFWFYDLIFLDVLYFNNHLGRKLFTQMFKNNHPKLIFKFLDEKTNLLEEIKIMSSFSTGIFLKTIYKRLFNL